MTHHLQATIEELWERRAELSPQSPPTTIAAIESVVGDLDAGKLRVIIEPTTGYYPNMAIKEQTFFYIYCDQHPDEIQLRAGDEEVVTLTEYGTPETLQRAKEGFYYDNKFCWPEGFKDLGATPRPALIIKLQERDIKQEKLEILVNNFRFANEQLVHQITDAALPLPVIGRRKRWPNARSPWGSKSFP